MPSPSERTAGLVVIGNEILSGKVHDRNSYFLARELRAGGVDLSRIEVVPDDVDVIAESVGRFSRTFDFVFTSGGIGPTHDDVTVEGVARAFSRIVVRDPGLEASLRRFHGSGINDARLKLADVPEGAELLFGGSVPFPTIKIRNVFLLPGIPEIFEVKVVGLRERFAGDPFHLRVIYSRLGEGEIAESLHRALDDFPELLLGSYPKLHDSEYAVKLTLESKDPDYVQRALSRILELLPEGCVVRTEAPEFRRNPDIEGRTQ